MSLEPNGADLGCQCWIAEVGLSLMQHYIDWIMIHFPYFETGFAFFEVDGAYFELDGVSVGIVRSLERM